MIGAVLFDLDGTLVDSEPQIRAALAATLEHAGFDAALVAGRPIIGPPIEELIAELTGGTGAEVTAIFESYVERYLRDYAPRLEPFGGAEELLSALAGRGLPLALVTNKHERPAQQILEFLGWGDRFAAVVGADSVARGKPAPDAAIEALRQLDARPHEAAIVGDTRYDIECGRDAGLLMTIGVSTGPASAEELAAAGATYVAESLAEVERLLLGAPTSAPVGPRC